jgi:hypothetical protein
MTRSEFIDQLSGLICNEIPEDRELTDDDEKALVDNLGDIAADILQDEEQSEEAEG